MKKSFLLLSVLILSACTDANGASEAIKNTGLEPVAVGGYSFFGCGKNEGWHTKFKAKRQDGQIVSGVVCDGLLKGATVRFN